ncbi:MAG: hypothetical protein R3F46_13705 [bacterium]
MFSKGNLLTIACLVSGSLSSCNGSSGNDVTPGFVPRYASLVVRVIENEEISSRVEGVITGQQGLELGFIVSHLNDFPPGGGAAVRKYEIDFGDGDGFVDVTADAGKWSDGGVGGEPSADQMTRHVYSVPGEYLARGRVTYWDGEMFDTSGDPVLFIPGSNLTIRIVEELP